FEDQLPAHLHVGLASLRFGNSVIRGIDVANEVVPFLSRRRVEEVEGELVRIRPFRPAHHLPHRHIPLVTTVPDVVGQLLPRHDPHRDFEPQLLKLRGQQPGHLKLLRIHGLRSGQQDQLPDAAYTGLTTGTPTSAAIVWCASRKPMLMHPSASVSAPSSPTARRPSSIMREMLRSRFFASSSTGMSTARTEASFSLTPTRCARWRMDGTTDSSTVITENRWPSVHAISIDASAGPTTGISTSSRPASS